MNRIVKRLATAGLVAVAACSGGTTIGGGTGPVQSENLTGTLQGIVADAVTGKRVGGDLKLFLIQGATVRGPSRLITGATDPLQGEYAFNGVPVDLASGDATWKVVAVATGYQRFEAEFSFLANSASGAGFPGNYLDTVYNKIGNIFLFPVGATAPDYSFTLLYNGKVVPGATVELDPLPATNLAKFNTTSDNLSPDTGYVEGIQATATDASGKTTVAGAGLALGGVYAVSVLPVTFTDTAGTKVQLGLLCAGSGESGCGTITVGFSDTNRVINLTDLTAAATGTPLYVATASNRPAGLLQADGKLTVTFNAPVSVPYLNAFSATVSSGTQVDGTAGKAALCPNTNCPTQEPVAATLSSDGLTLTLAPNFNPAPLATDRGVSITYTNGPPPPTNPVVFPGPGGFIEPKDYPAQVFVLFGTVPAGATQLTLLNETTAHVSGVVNISAP